LSEDIREKGVVAGIFKNEYLRVIAKILVYLLLFYLLIVIPKAFFGKDGIWVLIIVLAFIVYRLSKSENEA